jgi:hypothetical protein
VFRFSQATVIDVVISETSLFDLPLSLYVQWVSFSFDSAPANLEDISKSYSSKAK